MLDAAAAGREDARRRREVLGREVLDAWGSWRLLERGLLTPDEVAEAVAGGGLSIVEEIGLVGSRLPDIVSATDDSQRVMLNAAGNFVKRLKLEGVASLAEITERAVRDFMDEPSRRAGGYADPPVTTQRFRRDSIRFAIRVARRIGLVDPTFDPTVDIKLDRATPLQHRPFTDGEELLGRISADGTLSVTRRPSAWALGQATAVAGEIGQAIIPDVELVAGRVWLRGTYNREPRWGRLTPWGVQKLEERIEQLLADGRGTDAPLCRGPRAKARSAQTQACNAVRESMVLAGLADEPDLSPMSLANWAGRKVFHSTGRIDEAAKALGIRSLDTAAKAIGWRWR